MREIKFRFYHKALKKMSKVLGLGCIWEYLVEEWGIFDWKDVEKLQFTGLTDKNGKEIYEGDIVRWPYYKKHKTGKVGWGSCGFWIVGYLDVLWLRINEIEVIGNIYEKDNPSVQ